MKDVKFVIRFWGIPVKFIRKIPVTMADLTEKQYLSLVKYMNGQIREHRLITIMYNLPFFLFFTISRKKFWTYKLVESMETFSDFSKPGYRVRNYRVTAGSSKAFLLCNSCLPIRCTRNTLKLKMNSICIASWPPSIYRQARILQISIWSKGQLIWKKKE